MTDGQRFAYTAVPTAGGTATLRPFLPLSLAHGDASVSANGLLDTGADVNVLPYHLGLALGAIWLAQRTIAHLSGNLSGYEVRGLLLTGRVAGFGPTPLAFAWTRAADVPLILGQVNFFAEFDVCFFGSQKAFEVRSRR